MALAIGAICSSVSSGRALWRASNLITYRSRCFGLTWWYAVVSALEQRPERFDPVGVRLIPDALGN